MHRAFNHKHENELGTLARLQTQTTSHLIANLFSLLIHKVSSVLHFFSF